MWIKAHFPTTGPHQPCDSFIPYFLWSHSYRLWDAYQLLWSQRFGWSNYNSNKFCSEVITKKKRFTFTTTLVCHAMAAKTYIFMIWSWFYFCYHQYKWLLLLGLSYNLSSLNLFVFLSQCLLFARGEKTLQNRANSSNAFYPTAVYCCAIKTQPRAFRLVQKDWLTSLLRILHKYKHC